MKQRYLVTMTCLVDASSKRKAYDQLSPAVAKAMKVAIAGVALSGERVER